MQCVSTVSYSFLLNGQAKGSVFPQRGIRQGDPLSPYLFIICSEVLSCLYNKAQANGSLPGLRVAKGSPRVNHLLFADDTMFFCRSDLQSCRKLQSILQKLKTEQKRELHINKEGGQGKYLGLPELFGRKKKDLFSQIVDRIKQRALSWSSRFFSSAGKLTMLKSVLAAMPTYTMSCFHIPNSLCKRIQSALTRFWWDSSNGKKKMCWISWRKMTKSFKSGGTGETLPVYRSLWLFLNSPLSPMGPPTEAAQSLKVSDLLLPNTGEWNKELISLHLPMYEKNILTLKSSKKGAPDSWAWPPTPDGVYSAKSGYFEALHSAKKVDEPTTLLTDDTFNWRANIWSKKASPKTKLLLWKIAQNALPVGENLLTRHVNEEVWNLAPVKSMLQPESILSIKEGIKLSNNLTCLPPTGINGGPLSPWILWSLWTSRNNLMFSKKQIQASEVMCLSLMRAKEWQQAQIPSPSIIPICPPNLQSTVSPSSFCFTDAAWKPDGTAGFGWIAKDSSGLTLLEGSSATSHVGSPLMAEAMATLTTIEVALESDLKIISFASDSSNLVKALNLKLHSKELHGILHDILNLSSNFNCCSFNFITKNLNRQAHALAKEALLLYCTDS
ncbi:unnamed protein product [Arabidopsis halleri]